MSKGRPRTRIAILDTDRLRQAVKAVIEDQFGGKIAVAADSIGIERSLLSRLANGSAKSLSITDLNTLRRTLPRESFVKIERAVYPEPVIELLRAYDGWAAAERARQLHRESLPDTVVGRALRTVLAWETQRLMEYHALREVVSDKFPDLIDDFGVFLVKRKHFQNRADLAFIRILAPLLDSLDSGHVELTWQDLPDRKLRQFVAAGIEREKILLDRAPDLQRAQEVAERDPLDFLALYGQLWDTRAFLCRNIHPLVKKWIAVRTRQVETSPGAPNPSQPPRIAD